MLDHDARSLEDIVAAFDGHPVGNLTRDEVLDNITMTWVTNTGVSYQVPRSWAEKAYPNLIYFNELSEGNHFAALQEQELFTAELRTAFRSLR